jgi:exosome complex component RRP42
VPYPDSPGEGNLIVSADLLPLASPRYESGPPGFDAIELPRLVDRVIRNSGIVDFSKLVIKEGELVWVINIDIYPINNDGNVIDAASIGAVAALRQTVFPEADKEGKVDYEKKTNKKLPLSKDILPISFSFFKAGNSIILDPTREEEEACDARITFGISKWKEQYMINSCQKKGGASLVPEEISKMMELLPQKFNELDKKLKKLI